MMEQNLIRKYKSQSKDYVISLYNELLNTAAIMNLTDKQSVLDKYFNLSFGFYVTILSKKFNVKYPELVEQKRMIFEDLTDKFLDVFSNPDSNSEIKISADDFKKIRERAREDVKNILKKEDDLYS